MSLALPPALAALIGRTLGGRYRILRPIGAGGMGAVFEAEQLDLRRNVAVKVLVEVDAESIARLRQEAFAAGSLRSVHVVTVLDFQTNAGEPPFLVMELLDGEPLSTIVRREKQLEPTRAVRIAVQILAALDAAHAVGTTHRDIKPSNVLVTRGFTGDEHVKVLDFGIAKVDPSVAGVRTATGAVLGTPAYLAPEQIQGFPADPRTDVHAVGIVLYEMLSGRRPWASSGPALFMEILQETPAPLRSRAPGVPPSIADAVDRACARDPSQRFPTAAAMAQALLSAAPPSQPSLPAGTRVSAPPGWTTPAATLGPAPTRAGMPTIAAPETPISPPRHSTAPRSLPEAPAAMPPRAHRPDRAPIIVLVVLVIALFGVFGAIVAALAYLKNMPERPPKSATASAAPGSVSAPVAAPGAPGPDAATTASASSVPSPSPSGAPAPPKPPAAKPDSDKCQCVHDDGRRREALCPRAVASCSCYDAKGRQMCTVAFVYPADKSQGPDCATGNAGFTGPDAQNGSPCTGWTQDPDRRVSEKVIGTYVACVYCEGHKQYPGFHGKACRGFNVAGEAREGTWRCPNETTR